MKSKLAMSVGVLALLGLLGVSVAEMQTAQTEAVQDTQPVRVKAPSAAELPVPEEPPLPPLPARAVPDTLPAPSLQGVQPSESASGAPHARDTGPRRARGLYIRPDGITVGRVSYIDRNTLLLVRVPGALISFLQDRSIIAQGLTDERGMFAVRGLTPWAVYSVTTSSQNAVGMFAAVIRPIDHRDLSKPLRASEQRVGLTTGWVNDIRFTSLTQIAEGTEEADPTAAPQAPNEGQTVAASEAPQDAEEPEVAEDDDGTFEDYLDYEFHELQVMPRDDFIAALRAGLFGPDVGGLPPAGMYPGSGMGGGFGGGGGGGGGAGGGGGGGLGGALIGAGIGAGIGAALGASGDDDNQQASPFAP